MQRSVRLLAFVLLLGSAHSALAQSTSAPTTGAAATARGNPGVDIDTTLYPRPLAATVTQAPTLYTQQPAAGPAPINAGNILIIPMLTGGAFYDDNVFARNSNRQADWAGFVRPELAWRTNNWANLQAGGSAFVEKRWYNRFTSEDQVNAGATVGGELRPDADTQLVGRLNYLHAHEDRGASDSITATFDKPLRYDLFEAAGAINKRYERFWTSVGAGVAWINYQDADIAGTAISLAYRDGTIIRVPVRAGYVVAPSTSVFVEVAGNERNFRVDNFDSRGYRVVGGALFEPGPGSRVRGEIFAGYMYQDYKGSTLQTVSTWTYGGALAFLVAQNVTAAFEGRRDAREASLSGGVFTTDGVSVIETLAAGRIDWRILPNVVIGGGVSYLVDEFVGAGRTDRSVSPLASARWFVNPYLTLGFDYRNLTFDSSGFGVPTYYRNVYLLSAHMRFGPSSEPVRSAGLITK